MKITLSTEERGVTCTVDDPSAVTTFEAAQLFEQALRGCGFFPKGHLEFVEDGVDE